DRHFGDDGVHDQREAGRQEQAERSGPGHEAERIFFGVTRARENGHEQSAEGQDGDAGSSGKGGKEGAHENGYYRRASAEAAEERVEDANQSARRPALCEKIASKREQGQSGKHGIDNQTVVRNRNGGNRLIDAHEEDERDAAKTDQSRNAQNGSQAKKAERNGDEMLRVRKEIDGRGKQHRKDRTGQTGQPFLRRVP